MERQAHRLLLKGSSFEAGKTLGSIAGGIPELTQFMKLKEPFLSRQEEKQMLQLFDEFCPGLNEEIEGFAEELNIPAVQVMYYAMTYLRPGCSQMAILPSITDNGHTLMARNYDFNDAVEEMTLATTRINGKYAHIGSSIMQFGRADGMNEHGLAVSQSSAGLPVGNFEFAAKPAITGLQFWAVIRSVMENCRNVEEVIHWTKDMPIAYNINLIAACPDGSAVLLETFNGKKAYKRIDKDTKEQFIHSTNHVHLPELKAFAPMSMKNSLVRYKLIEETLSSMDRISMEDLKKLLTVKYPAGLRCNFYDDYFGCIRSMVFDVTDGIVYICFGTPADNKWYAFRVSDDVMQESYPVSMERAAAPDGFYDMIAE
jgi:predicted choloylglycine hydrolase